MPRISCNNHKATLHLQESEQQQEKSVYGKGKITSSLYKIKNTHEQKSQHIHNDISGVYLKKINFHPLSNLNTINSTTYINSELINSTIKNNVGIALDDTGNILIIKGKSKNLIKGIYNKYTSGYHYQCAKLSNNKDGLTFKNLYVNNKGMLIADNKNDESYFINFNKISSPLEKEEQSVILKIEKYKKKPSEESLVLHKKDMSTLHFHHKNNSLLLDRVKTPTKDIDYSIMEYDIKLPIKKSYLLKSIKKVNNHLQLEFRKGMKNRIYYLNPEHVSLKNLTARKLSHKPPQNFSSRLGCDPYEKYHSGQPFTSDRKGNFSSTYIPFFSSIIDNFRIHFKAAKEHKAQGENKKSFISIAKSVDPGLNALYAMTVDQIKNVKKNIAQGKMTDQQIMFTSMQSHTSSLLPIINHILEDTLPLDLSDAIISLMKKLKIRESISLQSSSMISGFFGIAVGGLPFNPGWFAGIVAMLAKNYQLALSRIDHDKVCITFSYRRKKSSILIAGTGQGLEKSLLHNNTIDYMTVMPAEANLILVTHCTKDRDFSFTLSLSDFEKFAKQLYNRHFHDQFINQCTFKNQRTKELLIMLEAKSEMRAQIGTLVNPTTYMVIPRSALGTRLALNLIELKSVSEKTITPHGKERENNLIVNLLTPEADLYHEEKIIPIVMRQDVELWCYPLPLIEEYRPINSISSKKHKVFSIDSQTDKIKNEMECNKKSSEDKIFTRLFSIYDIEKIPLTIEDSLSKTTDKNQLKKNEQHNKCVSLFIDKLSKIKKTLIQQERNNLQKQCNILFSCYYNFHHDKNDVSKYQLKKIEIRRKSTFNRLTATLPLTIISLESNNSISYDEILGDIDFLYSSSENEMPENIKFNLSIVY